MGSVKKTHIFSRPTLNVNAVLLVPKYVVNLNGIRMVQQYVETTYLERAGYVGMNWRQTHRVG